MPGRHESARIQAPPGARVMTQPFRPKSPFCTSPEMEACPALRSSEPPKVLARTRWNANSGTQYRTGHKSNNSQAPIKERTPETMGDVIPISKQGRFNLGPGTAPSNSSPNPSSKYVRPREVNTCWACGTHKPIPGEKYCVACVKAGRDNPMIECMYFDECATMARRRYKGQQYFICPRHKEKQA